MAIFDTPQTVQSPGSYVLQPPAHAGVFFVPRPRDPVTVPAAPLASGQTDADADGSTGTRPAPQAAAPSAQAEAHAAGRPAWVLVIPAEIDSVGKPHWGRDSAWSRAWIAPLRRGGMRLVATMGDADDHDKLPLAMLGEPRDGRAAMAANALARKYGAPAIAIVRYDSRDGDVGVWMWRGGALSSDAGDAASLDGGKLVALDMIVGFGNPATPPAQASSAETSEPDAGPRAGWSGNDAENRGAWSAVSEAAASESGMVETQPEKLPPARLRRGITVEDTESRDGRFAFVLRIEASDPAAQAEARRAVRNVIGLWMRAVRQNDDSIEIDGEWTGPDGHAGLVRALAQAGLGTR